MSMSFSLSRRPATREVDASLADRNERRGPVRRPTESAPRLFGGSGRLPLGFGKVALVRLEALRSARAGVVLPLTVAGRIAARTRARELALARLAGHVAFVADVDLLAADRVRHVLGLGHRPLRDLDLLAD